MIRAILKYKRKDQNSGAETEGIYTIDFDAPELEKELSSGGFSENGYDFTELIGVEVLGNKELASM